jgi:hypothetical protein
MTFCCNCIGGIDVGHPIPETAASIPSHHRDRRGKCTRTPTPDVSVDTEEESVEGHIYGSGTNILSIYLNLPLFSHTNLFTLSHCWDEV